MRASAALIHGRSVGGTERARDARGALRLLKDPEPLVRRAAAEALRYVHLVPGAAEVYDEGWEAVDAETRPQVKAALSRALERR